MFESIDKSWDERAVEGQSLRRMFVWLLSWALILGAGIAMMLHAFVHSHRFDWYSAFSFAGLGLVFVLYARAFYRRLDR